MGILADLDLTSIADARVRTGFVLLLNLVADLKRENTELRAENPQVRDEINRLKGEQGKPPLKGHTPKPPATHYFRSKNGEPPRSGPTAQGGAGRDGGGGLPRLRSAFRWCSS